MMSVTIRCNLLRFGGCSVGVALTFLLTETVQMTPENTLILAAIAAGLAACCVVLSLWTFVRLSALEARWRDVDAKLPPKRARELEEGFDAMMTAFEGLQQKNQEFKQSVHNSVNRLDQVMRRNEKAVAMLDQNGELRDAPDFVPAADPTGQADSVDLSKQAALRARYNKNRGIG